MAFSQFILEGQNENNAKAKLKKAGKEDIFDDLLSITEPYKGTNEGKNNKHLPTLVQFALDGTALDIIKSYYDRFIKNPKISNKPIDKLKDFREFEQLVDSTATKQDIEDKSIDDKPIYEDDNVKIFLGDSKSKCIKYGQGRKYGFCIARQDNSNLFHGYRKHGATFYFIYFNNREAQGNAPENLIVIHAYPNNRYKINYSTPNHDVEISKEEIISQFPTLEPIFDKVIKYIPHNEKEEKIYSYIENTESILELKTQDDRLLFIELGKEIKNKEWSKLKNVEELLSKYIEVGSHDIPDELQQQYPKLWKRYIDKLGDRVNIKFSDGIFDLSPHEKRLVQNNPNLVKPEIITGISKDISTAYDYASKVLKGQNVPPEIINVISKYSNIAYDYASKVLKGQNVPPEIINAISKDLHAYNYAKDVLKGKNVPPEIIRSISEYPSYAYEYARDVIKWQDIPPEIINSLRNSYYDIHKAASYVYNNEPVPPEIITGISKNPKYAYYYASKVLKGQNVPPEIITGISKDSKYAYYYASKVLKGQNVPPKIVIGISKDSNNAYNYASKVLNGKDVPPEIISSISKKPYDAYKYASEVLKWQDIPPEIINSLRNSYYDIHKAASYVYNNEPVPSEIITGISKVPRYAYRYASEVLKWQNVPQPIIDSIKKSGKDIPPNTTITTLTESFQDKIRKLFEI